MLHISSTLKPAHKLCYACKYECLKYFLKYVNFQQQDEAFPVVVSHLFDLNIISNYHSIIRFSSFKLGVFSHCLRNVRSFLRQ